MLDDEYAFGDDQGTVMFFKFTAAGQFTLGKDRIGTLAGPVKAIQFLHNQKATMAKMVVIGDCGPGGVQAVAQKVSTGMEAGQITGSAKSLNTSCITKALATKDVARLFSGGESGEVFMHEGAPFKGQG